MTVLVSVGVRKDGDGWGAFGYEADGTAHRLSPTWIRETFIEAVQEFQAPMKNDAKRMVTVKAQKPLKTGHRLKVGEPLVTATERARRALELLATGKQPKIPPAKEVLS